MKGGRAVRARGACGVPECACVRARALPRPSLPGGGASGGPAQSTAGPSEGAESALLDDEAAGQVLREVLEELGGGPGAVGQLQLLQLLQLHQARQPGGCQKRTACGGGRRGAAERPGPARRLGPLT